MGPPTPSYKLAVGKEDKRVDEIPCTESDQKQHLAAPMSRSFPRALHGLKTSTRFLSQSSRVVVTSTHFDIRETWTLGLLLCLLSDNGENLFYFMGFAVVCCLCHGLT